MALLKRKRIGLTDAMSVVTKFVNACNRHDADGVASCLHPDFDSIQPIYPARNFRGADQVRRNWQAIFDAEPGFRLTVLRSAAADDTVWLELHGAGRDAEVAGVFVMGVVGDRIRWARIYSALVEPVPGGTGDASAPAPLREVPPIGSPAPAENGEVVEEDMIAPVLDIERSSRRRRRRRAEEASADAPVVDEIAVVEPESAVADVMTEPEPDPAPVVEPEAPAVDLVDDGPDTEAVAVLEWDDDSALEDLFESPVAPEEVVTVIVTEPEVQADPELAAEPAHADEDNAPPATGTPAAGEPKRRFGKRPRI